MSLRARLILLTCGLAVVLLGGLGLYLHAAWEDWAQTILVESLERRADAIALSLELEHDGELEIESEEAFADDPAHPFRVEDTAGRVLFEAPFDWPNLPQGALRLGEIAEAENGTLLVLSRRVEVKKHYRQTLVLRVVASREPFLALERRFVAGLRVALLVALVLGAALAAGLARFFVAPIERLSSSVAGLGARSLHERVTEERLAPELKTLASSFNGLLARLETAFHRERDFVARASHALRTPAATLLTQAEVALRRERTAEEYRRALEGIVAEARIAARLTDELLALSRLDDRATSATEQVALDVVARDLRTLFSAPAAQRALALEVEVPANLSVRAEPGLLREALSNLLDNAVRYTPASGRVGLTARPRGARIELVVWDTGPGISDTEKPLVVERFRRGEAGAQVAGSGLGLAIVQAIAEAQGATLQLRDRAGGGLEAVLDWPAS